MTVDQENAKSDAAIYTFQWSPPEERDELRQAMIIVEAELLQPDGGRTSEAIVPDVLDCIVDQPNGPAFLNAVQDGLRGKTNVQLVYVGAHGLEGNVLFGARGASRVSYADLGASLQAGLDCSDTVTVVFGMCESLENEKALLATLPGSINEVYGFTGKPLSRDVAALLAGIIVDDMRLLKNLAAENTAVFGAGVRWNDFDKANAELTERFDRVLDNHDPEPEHFVNSPSGKSVRHYKRENGDDWQFIEVLTVPGRRYDEPTKSAVTR